MSTQKYPESSSLLIIYLGRYNFVHEGYMYIIKAGATRAGEATGGNDIVADIEMATKRRELCPGVDFKHRKP
jgi:hypothetical protein